MSSSLNWSNARLPADTAVFAIGDIHAHHTLLSTLLPAIEKKIDALPPGTTSHVIGIGDYIDRGESAPETVSLLLDFQKRMKEKPNVKVYYLCGNHDEVFKRLLDAKEIIIDPADDALDVKDHHLCLDKGEGKLGLRGLEAWLFSGGGLTTVRDYLPQFDKSLIDEQNKCFNRRHPDFSLATVNRILHDLQAAVPQAHKDFFAHTYDNQSLIIGDYLFTHAGVDPEKQLEDQGIGIHAARLRGAAKLDAVMIRNPFLWRDGLPNCPYVVIHGHTPSAIESKLRTTDGIIADGQKDYRLCIDTAVYNPKGALTCFERHGNTAQFVAVTNEDPHTAIEYNIPAIGRELSAAQHTRKFPQYHQSPGMQARD